MPSLNYLFSALCNDMLVVSFKNSLNVGGGLTQMLQNREKRLIMTKLSHQLAKLFSNYLGTPSLVLSMHC